ncbi:lysM domain receptor-like kinase 3 [Hordeum vulgare]|uniref:LysM domain receptor-like kinase 3 n=1 Tax=Hordeum vulgare subsp. vulgare TaxID=112509 RepID=A0A8I6WTC5_HORVV|nr:lysM domain receptor-like kinase 3 [Hordeum vulgare subsp. vulgare]KAE8775575.1 lysM domain receptor-like kinase 3 [Hordeum vulgare]
MPPRRRLLLLLLALACSGGGAAVDTAPGNGTSSPLACSELSRVCTAFLAFPAAGNASVLQSMFDASPGDLTSDPAASPGYAFVRKNCSCLASRTYLANTTYTIPSTVPLNATAAQVAAAAYGGLAVPPPGGALQRPPRPGAVVALHLICGCSSGPWNYLLSYVGSDGDTVESLSSRFGASMDAIEAANGMPGPDPITTGKVYYIPLNSVPGQPYVAMSSAPVPAPAPTQNTLSEISDHHSAKFPYGWVIGGMGVALALIAIALLALLMCKSFQYNHQGSNNQGKSPDQPMPHNFQLLKSGSFCYGSGRYFCCQFGNAKQSRKGGEDHHINVPKGMVVDVFDREKPIVFTYEEILASTDLFSDANLLGHGTYGSVYYGVLRDQEVAIKRMTSTNTKEFIVEMKVLCKVHHASLVELIGYAASKDELFLVYEYSQKGSLRNHLHDPQSKGYTSLSWIYRVQIALDAARGLEYIHEHTKDHYVHRDIKSSNILLDGSFRAKISDFGLAKLGLRSNDAEASVTKVVGTFGYLAPEYLRDGLATAKCDVYAFGVVLFELISGKEAITKADAVGASSNSERRSLASVMLTALRNCHDPTCVGSLKDCIDPNLMDLYPHDCIYQMAMLAKQCADEDPVLRPDMKQAVITLSQILLSSIEWEATLGGNSQVFSGLVAGR